jgi:hypothetical protein
MLKNKKNKKQKWNVKMSLNKNDIHALIPNSQNFLLYSLLI